MIIIKVLLFLPTILTAQADVTSLQKQCLKNQSRKICSCVSLNLQRKLRSADLQRLSVIEKDRISKIQAQKSPHDRSLIQLHFEIQRQCAGDTQWVAPAEDMGQPDPL